LRPILAPAEREGHDTSRVYLLLDELLSNIHRHGYDGTCGKPIGVRVRVHGEFVYLAVRDRARTFDTAVHATTRTAPPPESGQKGGMGLFIVHSMCDSFVHRVPNDGGNSVYLVMRLPRRVGAGADARETRRNRDGSVAGK
jgi:anti-sigma regulatory factor (Ser/Thr protein kinase)